MNQKLNKLLRSRKQKTKSEPKNELTDRIPPTLGKLFRTVEWEEVWKQLQSIYDTFDETEPAYLNAFNKACAIETSRGIISSYAFTIDKVTLPDGKTVYDILSSHRATLEFSPWKRWVDSPIWPDSSPDFSDAEIVAHCLHEMTLHGFSEEEVRKKLDSFKFVPPPPEDEYAMDLPNTKALVSVPDTVNPAGLYAVTYYQEVHYLHGGGNALERETCFLDLKEDMVYQGVQDKFDMLKKWLLKKETPLFRSEGAEGFMKFSATEIPKEKADAIRNAVTEFRKQQERFDQANAKFHTETEKLNGYFYVEITPYSESKKVSQVVLKQKNETLGKLFKSVEWQNVWKQLQAIYKIPDKSKADYLNAFNEIRELESIASGEMKITIKKESDPDCELGVFWDVSGDGRYGLDFMSWNEWKGLKISEVTRSEFSIPKIVAHCLEEMTFFGFSKDTISNELEKFNESMQERLHAMRNGKGITLEESQAIIVEED